MKLGSPPTLHPPRPRSHAPNPGPRTPLSAFRLPLSVSLSIWLLITALLLWFFSGALFGGGLFAYRDAAHYYYPLFRFIQQQWSQGTLPLWNPQENLGAPLLGNATSSVLYPGKLIFLLPFTYAWQFRLYTIGHVLLAAIGGYALARRFHASHFAAGIAAISYAFCGNVLFQYTNVIFLVGAAWLPLAFLAAHQMLAARSARGAVALGVVLALMVLGGDPETAYHAGLLILLYALLLRRFDAPAAASAPVPTFSLRSRPALLLLAAACAFLLAAVQVLPSTEFSLHTSRAAAATPRSLYELPARLADTSTADTTWYDGLLCRNFDPRTHRHHVYQFSVAPWRLTEYLWPNVGGRQFPIHRRWFDIVPAEGRLWVPSLYMGILPLILALLAWRLRRGDPKTRWMSSAALLAILASFGWYGVGWFAREILYAVGADPANTWIGAPVGGLYWLMTVLLPGYIYFRYPAKLMIVAALALSILAAEGWDRFLVPRSRTLRRSLLVLASVSVTGFAIALIIRPLWFTWMAGAAPNPLFGPLDVAGAHRDLTLAFLQTALVCAALFGLLRLPDRFRWTPAAALALVAVDLALANGWFVACASPQTFQHPPLAATILNSHSSPRPLAEDGPGVRAASLAETTPLQPYRITRQSIWVPPSWATTSSPQRLTQLARWSRDSLWPNYQLPAGLSLANVSTTMITQDYRTVLSTIREPETASLCNLPLLERYAIRRSPPPNAEAQRIELSPADAAQLDDVSLWYFPDHLPRAWIVHHVDVLPPLQQDDPDSVRRRTNQVFWPQPSPNSREKRQPAAPPRDLRRSAVVETSRPANSFPDHSNRPTTSESCQILLYKPLHIEIEAVLQRPGLVILCDQFYPGWTLEVATADQPARPMPILQTNRVMRGVWLPAGTHRLIYRYRPTTFFLGAAISLAAWIVLAIALPFARLRP